MHPSELAILVGTIQPQGQNSRRQPIPCFIGCHRCFSLPCTFRLDERSAALLSGNQKSPDQGYTHAFREVRNCSSFSSGILNYRGFTLASVAWQGRHVVSGFCPVLVRQNKTR